MINRNGIITFLLFAFIGIQTGTGFLPSQYTLGLDVQPVFEVSSLALGADSLQLPMVAGVSTFNELCLPLINIVIN